MCHHTNSEKRILNIIEATTRKSYIKKDNRNIIVKKRKACSMFNNKIIKLQDTNKTTTKHNMQYAIRKTQAIDKRQHAKRKM